MPSPRLFFLRLSLVFLLLTRVVPGHCATQPLSLHLPGSPQWAYAGIYAAQEKGFFREHLLQVTLVEEPLSDTVVATVLAQPSRYGVAPGGELVWHRLQGSPVVALAVLLQQSPTTLLLRPGSPVRSPADLAGRSLFLESFAVTLEVRALLRSQGVAESKITGLPARQWQQADAVGCSQLRPWSALQRASPGWRSLQLSQFGIDFYGETLFGSAAGLKAHPERAAALRAAVLAGWDYALNHPEEAEAWILARSPANAPGIPQEQLRWERLQMERLASPSRLEVGQMQLRHWENMGDTLLRLGLAQKKGTLTGFVFSPAPQTGPWMTRMGMGAVALLFLLGLIAAWNRKLSRQVERRSRELDQKNLELVQGLAELEKARAALQWSEETNRRILEVAPCGVALLSLEGEVLQSNPAATRFASLFRWMGKKSESESAEAQMIRADGAAFPVEETAAYQCLASGRAATPTEFGYRTAANAMEWGLAYATPLTDPQTGRMTGVVCAFVDITERRLIEEALRQSQERYRAYLSNSTEALFCFEMERPVPLAATPEEQIHQLYEVVYLAECNHAMARMFGAERPDQLLGRRLETFLPRSYPPGQELLARAIEARYRLENAEFTEIDAQGEMRIFSSTFVGVIENGHLLRAWGSRQEVTERRKVEQALRESEEGFRNAFLYTTIGMAVLSPQGILQQVNPALAEMLGYSGGELCGIDYKTITHPDDLENCQNQVQALVLGQLDHFQLEKRYLRKNGELIWALLSLSLVRDAEGQPIYYIAHLQNLTERHQAEEVVAEQHRLLRTLLDSVPDLISIKDCQSRFLLSNLAHARALGMENQAEAIGKWDFDFFPPDLAQRYFDDDQEVMRSGRTLENRVEPLRHDRWVLTMKVPLRDPAGVVNGMVTISRDITDQLSLEAQLRQLQKMESIGQLAAGVAHDFNNLLSVIFGYTNLLLANEQITSVDKEPAREILSATERAVNLTRQLLTFSRRQVMALQPVHLGTTLGNLREMLTRLLGESIRLELEVEENLETIQADNGMMEQVIVNLVVNSRDAMEGGGRVLITARNCWLNPEDAKRNPEAHSGSFVCLGVRDEGCGISAEALPKIFDPFFTTKPAGKGTGLGLSTVYGIVKQHQGWMEVESAAGRGSLFKAYLPVAGHAPTQPTRSSSSALPGGREKILLVEDEAGLRLLAMKILKRYGYDVLEAAHGVEALAVWKEQGGGIDLLLTDMVMPMGLNGRDLAQRLRAERPHLKVVFTSGYSAESLTFDSGDPVYFLAKPYQPQAMLQMVRQCLDAV